MSAAGPGVSIDPGSVRIFDTTLRDGDAAGLLGDPADRLEVAR